jgi:hypothetical protein
MIRRNNLLPSWFRHLRDITFPAGKEQLLRLVDVFLNSPNVYLRFNMSVLSLSPLS